MTEVLNELQFLPLAGYVALAIIGLAIVGIMITIGAIIVGRQHGKELADGQN